MKEKRVLVTEDDIDSAFILKSILLKAGYKVVAVVETGQGAIEKAKELMPDIVLMDINIQGDIDGIEAASKIHKELKLPIIYLTGQSDPMTVDRAKESEPFGFILKPYTPKEVQITLEMALYKSSTEQKLKASEEKLSVTLASLQDAVITIKPQGHIDYINPIAEKHFNTPLAEAEGCFIESLLTLFDFETGEPIPSLFTFLISSKTPEDFYRHFSTTNKFGREFIIQLRVSKHLDSDGHVESYTIVLHDVTKQYRAEKQNRMMATVLESMQDAVVVVEKDNSHAVTVVYVNSSFEQLSGRKKEQFVGASITNLCNHQQNDHLLFAIEHAFKTKRAFKLELVCQREGGKSLITQWDGFPVTDKRGQLLYFALIIRDITQTRKIEENLRRSQKIEAIGRLTSGIAHDFNNILSVINAYSDILKLNIHPETPFYKYVENIRDAGTKGANIVSQLMTFSRREPTDPHRVDIVKVIQGMTHILEPLLSKSIEFDIQCQDGIYPVRGDETQIEQILVNLCVNARDAMPNGGRLEIKVCNYDFDPDKSKRLEYMKAGTYVRLRVLDTGEGMDEETQKHIFDPFFTTKRIGEGTGLGLSTVYGIVKQYGGYVDVKSARGEGSRFDIYFPVFWETAESNAHEAPELASDLTPFKNAALCVQDSALAQRLSNILQLSGYTVSSDPTSAAPDLFILDLDTNSATLLETFEQQNPNGCIITLSSNPALNPTLLKPFSLNAFREKVQTANQVALSL
ncbi:MAG TPA: hypothetical protein DHV51_01860 [Opitutae bacterium]|nr:hypothetical protein [Opitutae bacterium]